MKTQVASLKLYIGAATRGQGENKWSWPGRDLRYLYEATYTHGIEVSIEPDLDTWIKFGMVVWKLTDGTELKDTFENMSKQLGLIEARRIVSSSRGVYLEEGKEITLDKLGCPK